MTCGSVICGHLSDWAHRRHLEKTKAKEAAPERRLHLQFIGTALFPIGVLIYGWLGNFSIGVPGVIISMAICLSAPNYPFHIGAGLANIIKADLHSRGRFRPTPHM